MTLDELAAYLIAEGAKRRATAELAMFESGLTFEAISEGLELMRS
jgi:hypothetical protein